MRCTARRSLLLVHANSCAPQLCIALCEGLLALTLHIIGAAKTGSKAWLRRRLHAAIVRAHLEAADVGDGL